MSENQCNYIRIRQYIPHRQLCYSKARILGTHQTSTYETLNIFVWQILLLPNAISETQQVLKYKSPNTCFLSFPTNKFPISIKLLRVSTPTHPCLSLSFPKTPSPWAQDIWVLDLSTFTNCQRTDVQNSILITKHLAMQATNCHRHDFDWSVFSCWHQYHPHN